MKTLHVVGRDNVKLGAVQVNVVDYKPFSNAESISPTEMDIVQNATRTLLEELRMYTTIVQPGEDKVSAVTELRSNQIGDQLELLIKFGKTGQPFKKDFDLPLPKSLRGFSAADLHSALQNIGRIDPGGNVPNMVRNIVHLMSMNLMPPDFEVHLYSTSEPVFQQWYDSLAEHIRDRVHRTLLQIPSRTSIHLAYPGEKSTIETMGLVSPMHSTVNAVQPYMDTLAGCNHVLVSESLQPNIQSDTLARTYQEFQNPSSAFRSKCGIASYDMVIDRKYPVQHIPFVSLNHTEMVTYLKSVEDRRDIMNQVGQQKKNEPSFNEPFDRNGHISTATVRNVTDSLQRYFTCITPTNNSSMYYPLSITCKASGGYTVAVSSDRGEKHVIFSSVPTEKGSERMLALAGNHPDMSIDKHSTMGAGDSVASVISAVHLWNLEEMLGRLRQEDRHPLDAKFMEKASMIFTSLLGRFAGMILVHSDRCDWSCVSKEAFQNMILRTAEKSLDLAAACWSSGEYIQVMKEPEWGIDIATWKL